MELFANLDWPRCIGEAGGLVEGRKYRFLAPAPFFEKALRAVLAADRGA